MRNNDELFFITVLEENKDKIYRICRIYAVSPIEPQDLFQEVVYEVWKSFATFKGKSSISTWIYKIALNVCTRSKMKFDKKNGRMVQLESVQFEHMENKLDKNHEGKYKALHDCISLLNETDKSIVILSLEELPYKEIASVMGFTENYIAVKMRRIRKLLLDCIIPKLR